MIIPLGGFAPPNGINDDIAWDVVNEAVEDKEDHLSV